MAKLTIPSADWLSGPSSSSAGPQIRAESPEPGVSAVATEKVRSQLICGGDCFYECRNGYAKGNLMHMSKIFLVILISAHTFRILLLQNHTHRNGFATHELVRISPTSRSRRGTVENLRKSEKMSACIVPLESSGAYCSMICSGSLSKGSVLIFTQRSPAVVSDELCLSCPKDFRDCRVSKKKKQAQ